MSLIRRRHILPAFLVVMLVSSCVYSYDDIPTGSDEAIPVFHGSIVLGEKAVFSYSWMQNLQGKYPSVISSDPQFSWWVEDDLGNRYERSDETGYVDLTEAPDDRSYRICAELLGKTYESSLERALPTPEITDIGFSADDENVLVSISFAEADGATGYMALTYEETWEFHVDFIPEYLVNTLSWTVYSISDLMMPIESNYYCWRSYTNGSDIVVDLSRIDGPISDYPLAQFSRRSNRNHRKYSILAKARSITKEEYDYRHNLDLNEEGGNNLFRPNPGEIAGNISCVSDPSQKALGYISLSKSASRRAFLDNRYLISVPPDNNVLMAVTPASYQYYYNTLEYRPVKEIMVNGERVVGWGPLRCVDCVADGGTLEQPDFWE